MTKKIDIFDLLTKEAIDRIDDIGYELLKENGYETDGAKESQQKQRELKKVLEKDGRQLIYFSMIERETSNILFWFELHKGAEVIARSKVLKFVPEKGGKNGEGESQERPSETPKDNA